MMRMYIWQQKTWPSFQRSDSSILVPLSATRMKQGQLLGRMSQLGFEFGQEAQLDALSEDVVKTSEIEGEYLNRSEVRSSVAVQLGLPQAGIPSHDARVDGVVAMLLDATQNFNAPLTKKRLWGWHASLFPGGYSGLRPVKVARWRNDADGPMQVVSGPAGKQKVHFEAPPASAVELEIKHFLNWFNQREEKDGLVRAAIAHLWFVTIHPFEDGNGRIARAIADMALAQSEESSKRFYSMSGQIRLERKKYYQILEQTQRGNLDITPWLVWFLECLERAICSADVVCSSVLAKADFWKRNSLKDLNGRQTKVLNRWLTGIDGKMTTKKWAAFAKCSLPTAQRDISDLIEKGVILRNPGGSKNSSYRLIL